jgi:S-adenosylmethionine-diacylglycerol 3-amino-3-carboxypropyl transferase
VRLQEKTEYRYAKLGYLLRFVHQLARVLRIDPEKRLQAQTLDEQRQIFDHSIAPFFDNNIVRLLGRQPLVLFSLGIPPR